MLETLTSQVISKLRLLQQIKIVATMSQNVNPGEYIALSFLSDRVLSFARIAYISLVVRKS